MPRKPACMYRNVKGPANTNRKFMGGVPGSKVVTYDMGDLTTKFPLYLSVLSEEACQIRHSALEAGRISANRYLTKKIGNLRYHLKIRIFPHHVLRENKQATGAGADRVSQGMRSAFGKNVGTAARVKSGQKLMTLGVPENYLKEAKSALKRAGQNFPTPVKIIVEKGYPY